MGNHWEDQSQVRDYLPQHSDTKGMFEDFNADTFHP